MTLTQRIAMAKIQRADSRPAPSYGETLPEWRRRAEQQVRRNGYVAVWVSGNMSPVL